MPGDAALRLISVADDATREQIRSLRKACGCREGAILMLVALAAVVVYLIGAEPRSAGSMALVIGAALFAGAGVGKAIGLVVARIRLRLLLRRYSARSSAFE